MEIKKNIESLINGIDEFSSKYITYNAKSLQKVLEKILNYVEHKEQECEKINQALNEIETYCKECNLKADFTACEILDIIDKIKK